MNSLALLLVMLAAACLSSTNSLKKQTPEVLSKTFDLKNKTNFVVYWGSTDNEGTLSDYCNDNIYDVIILAFSNAFDQDGLPQMSMDGCDGQDCSSLGPQIQSCQNKDKTIMLSVGGADGSYNLTSTDFAQKVAKHLWNMFLNGTGEKRPFGNGVVLDGVDFDIEEGEKSADGYWVTLINELRTLSKVDPSKHYYLSGAPQCVFPDEWFGPGSQTVISDADIDFISIQFYNNYCGIQSFFEPGKNFNFDQWSSAVTKANEKMKILLGIPASQSAGDGYQSAQNITKIYDTIKGATNFAGIMMWDAADAKHNDNFGQQIRNGCLSSAAVPILLNINYFVFAPILFS